jgi:hypothetical protein
VGGRRSSVGRGETGRRTASTTTVSNLAPARIRSVHDYLIRNNIVTIYVCVTIDGVWIGWIGFTDHLYTPLGTTSNSAPLISRLYKSPQLLLSIFSPAVSPKAGP